MENAMIILIGYPGIGKLTVAKEICAREKMKLVDNHLIANPIFALVDKVGGKMPEEVWDYTKRIRDVVYDGMVNLSPRAMNFMMTGCMFQENEDDQQWFKDLKAVADARGATLLPVRLTCDKDVNAERVVSEERIKMMKLSKVDRLMSIRERYSLLETGHPHQMDLDITHLTPQESAAKIVERVKILQERSAGRA